MDKKNILLVDDDEIILDVVKETLENFNYRVTLCNSPQKAIDILGRDRFNLIITDLSMEVMTGIELSRYIIKHHQDPPPIIIMTGYGSIETVVEAMQLGVKNYILKPFKVSNFINVVEKTIKNAELEKENLKLKEFLEIYALSENINNTLDINDVSGKLINNIHKIMKPDISALYLNKNFNIFKTSPDIFVTNEKDKLIANSLFEKIPTKIYLDTILKLLKNTNSPYYYSDTKINLNIDIDYKSILVYILKTSEILGFAVMIYLHQTSDIYKKKLSPLKIIFDEGSIAIENANLHQKNKDIFLKVLQSLAMTIDAKDAYTHYHSINVSIYSKILAKKLQLPEKEIEEIGYGSLLHDIGKIGIPESILNKPSKLTDTEYEHMKQHPVIGKSILHSMKEQFPTLLDMVYYHHERYDGKGYPDGLDKNTIPLYVKIITLADSFDAMSSDRSYRMKLPFNIIVEEIKKNRGTQFDPDVVDSFLESLPEIQSKLQKPNGGVNGSN